MNDVTPSRFWWKSLLGLPACPIAYTWGADFGLFSIRLHHWMKSEVGEHNHPWSFLTVVLAGGYTDVSDKRDELSRGSIRFRRANHRHRIETNGAWTLVFTGPKRNPWGFFEGGRFLPPLRYFAKFRRQLCD